METGDKYYGDTVGFVAVSYVTAHTEEAVKTLSDKQDALDAANSTLTTNQGLLDDANEAP